MRQISDGPKLDMGPCTYDVHTEGGGGPGGFKNCPIMRTNSTDRLREMRTREGGSNIPKILQTSYVLF